MTLVAFLLLLTGLAAAQQQLQQCSSLQINNNVTSLYLDGTSCFQILSSGPAVSISNAQLIIDSTQQNVPWIVNMDYGVGRLHVMPGASLEIRNAYVKQVLLFPAFSSRAITPCMATVAQSGRFTMVNSTLVVGCGVLSSYMSNSARFGANVTVMGSNQLLVSSYTIPAQDAMGSVTLQNVTLKCSSSSPQPPDILQFAVSSAMELQQGMIAVSLMGQQAAVMLLQNVSLAAADLAVWPSAGYSMPDHFNISGSPDVPTVLDLAGVPVFFELAMGKFTHVNNLQLQGLCMQMYTVNAELGITFVSASYLFPIQMDAGARVMRFLQVNNGTIVTSMNEIAASVLWAMYPSAFPKMNSYATLALSGGFTSTRAIVSAASTTSLTYLTHEADVSLWLNTTLSSKPVVAVNATGFDNKQVVCSTGQPAPASWLAVNRTLYPVWFVDTTDSMRQGLINVAAVTTTAGSLYLPAMLMILANATLPQDLQLLGMRRDFVVDGPPLNNINCTSVLGSPTRVVLDLAGVVDLFKFAETPDQGMFMQRLTLRNGAARPLSQLGIGTPSANEPSYMLPLFMIRTATGRPYTQIHMNAVTIVLPVSEYALLYAAAARASRGVNWKGGNGLGVPLIQALTTFKLERPPAASNIAFDSLQGLGLNLTNLLLVPDAPFDPASLPPEPITYPPPSPSPAPPAAIGGGPSGDSSDSSSNTGAIVGGVVGGVGGGVLLIALVAVYLVKRNRREPPAFSGDATALDGSPQDVSSATGQQHPAFRASSITSDVEGSKLSESYSRAQKEKERDSMRRIAVLNSSSSAATSQPAYHASNEGASVARQSAAPSSGAGGGLSPIPSHVATSYGSTGQGSKAKGPATSEKSGSSNADGRWDPMKQVQELAQGLKADADKLVLLEPIGRGGFGTVYRGQWRNLEVAVKTVLFSEKGGVAARQRAIMEAAVCTSVTHPNVVATYHYDIQEVSHVPAPAGSTHSGRLKIEDSTGAGATDWKLFLVQEFCNASLSHVLASSVMHNRTSKKPDLDLVLTVLLDIAKGVQYLHSKNIIHGDLKPENVLLKNDVSSPIGVLAKITDFGLSTQIDPMASHISNVSNGTPYYAAPEITATGQVHKMSDVYSFGVIMWEVFCCTPPWIRTETGGFIPNKNFRRFPQDAPPPFMRLTDRCLDHNPKTRPTFDEVIADLTTMHSAFLAGHSSLMMPQPRAPQQLAAAPLVPAPTPAQVTGAAAWPYPAVPPPAAAPPNYNGNAQQQAAPLPPPLLAQRAQQQPAAGRSVELPSASELCVINIVSSGLRTEAFNTYFIAAGAAASAYDADTNNMVRAEALAKGAASNGSSQVHTEGGPMSLSGPMALVNATKKALQDAAGTQG